MVIKCWKEDGKWKFDERDASLIPSLRVLFQDKEQKFGREYVVFVVLYADPLSIFATFKEDNDRHKMAAHAVWGDTIPAKALKDKLIGEACDEYARFASTTEAQAMQAMESTLSKIIRQLNDSEVTDDNMKELGEISAKIPTWLDSYKKIRDKAQVEEGNVIEKVKGGGSLSWAERKYSK